MKKQKVVITGSLGYIGSTLCELLSGEARYKDIVCIDNRFISGRVSQLRSWGMTFIQGSILDKELLQNHLHDADVVYHLAGITDVAYTATQSNPVQDKLISDVGIIGTQNVLSAISTTCKLIFPSTHVVFEGYKGTMFELSETALTEPKLTYAIGKVISERDIKSHCFQSTESVPTYTLISNYVIVRLGSVYGYSGDTMRINIMPNLFSKIASQDGTINLFGGGIQYKSLVNVIDAARAMKYLAEGNYTGTYHLSNENMTVKQVADICKSVNPNVTLQETTDEIPNQGYTLSNARLLATGFKFLYNIQDSIREMISKWSYRNTDTELEYIQKGGDEFIDQRGYIRNYELTEPINLIGYISSTRETIRANHYHPIQEQKCLLISGRYVSVTQDLSYPNAPIEERVIRPGDIAVIRPNVAHTMVFLQDSIFLNLVRGEREHHNYGITHTIPYTLVDEGYRLRILSMYRSTCRACGNINLKQAISLGMSPLANNLLDTQDQQCDMYPLDMDYCPECYNCQLSIVVPPEKMFNNYLYVSSTSATFRNHFEQTAEQYIRDFNLTSNSLVLDIGSNDGVFLKPLQQRGIRVVGVEPAANLAELANNGGIPTIHNYFNRTAASQVYEQFGSPDIITASNVFAHADDLAGIANAAMQLLKNTGTFIIEVQYLMDTIKDLTFDNIYHEHVNYWSVHSLNTFFNKLGYFLYKVEHIDTHGGSIRCYVCQSEAYEPAFNIEDISVWDFMQSELLHGINSYGTFQTFAQRVADIRTQVRANMQLLKQRFPLICGYGSPAKATTALNYFNITSDDIRYTIEDNELKCGKYLPGVNIPIGNHQYGPPQTPDVCIVLAWNFFDSIVRNHEYMVKQGTRFISIKDLEITDGMPALDTSAYELKGTPVSGKVYDCFLFFNELDLLELRLNILDSVIDYFVICEANITHSGVPREFCFEQHRDRFSKWSDKIIYVQITDIPQNFQQLPSYIDTMFYDFGIDCYNRINSAIQSASNINLNAPLQCREYWQRESIIRGLQNCTQDDTIMLSDIDEIPNPHTLKYLFQNFNNDQVYSLRQNSYYYYLNLLKERHWVGPRIASFKRFSEQPVGTFRHIRDLLVANGGWHFSFQTASGVRNKLTSYSHCDMATDDVLDKLQDRIEQGIDPFNRSKLNRVEIDNTFPQYMLDNIEQYKHMII